MKNDNKNEKNCTNNNAHKFTRNCMQSGKDKTKKKCSECTHRKWVGDYNLSVCDVSGKVVEVYYYCDLEEI